jgi:hypothetical protein
MEKRICAVPEGDGVFHARSDSDLVKEPMASADKIRLEFSVLVYPEDHWWIAHCLEMDLPAEGDTPDKAIRNLVDIALVQIRSALSEGDLQSIFSAAPPELWKAFAIATDLTPPRKRLAKPIERLNVRELAHR